MDREAEIKSADSGNCFLTAFQTIARYFERPTSRTVLLAGMSVEDSELSFEDIERIANRIGLEAELAGPQAAKSLNVPFPAIVECETGPPLALFGAGEPEHFTTTPGHDGDKGEISLDELKNRGIRRVISFSLIYLNAADRAETGTGFTIENRHWLFGSLRGFWRGYLHIALAAIFINTLGLASPLFIMNVYDRILPNKATSTLLALAAGVFIAFLFDFLLKTARSKIIDHTGREVDQKISYLLFDKILNTALASRPLSTGEYANRVSQLEFVREFFTSNTLSILIDTVFVFIFIFVIYLVGGWLFVIPLIAFFIAVTAGVIAQFRIGRRVARAANEASHRQGLLVETISTIETVKSLRAEGPLLRKWTEITKNSSRTSEEIKQLSAGVANITQFIQQMVSVAIVIAGAYEFSAGNISTGAIIACVILSGKSVAPLMQISLTLARMRQAFLSLKILDSIMQQPEDRPKSAGFVNRKIDSGNFVFQNVSFTYPGTDLPALKNLHFRSRAGERIGIIGRIGSGKTTLGRLMSGLYIAQDGRVLIDNVDIRQYHPAEVRSAIAFAGQSSDLFSGTLKENLLLGRHDARDREIIEAAKLSGVDYFASQHPLGYDMPVGERGEGLSGGQKQSIVLARLLLNKPKVVFLDEPTGAMDLTTERQLIGNLSQAFGRDVTLIIATHRYSLLDLVDRLIVLEQGAIVADGPKDKVMSALMAKAKMAKQGEGAD